MTKFQLLSSLEKTGLLRVLTSEGVINPRIYIRYERYKALLERFAANPSEKRSYIILDLSIELNLSTQTIYDDIRSMEKQIL
jgi:hypothetical protein